MQDCCSLHNRLLDRLQMRNTDHFRLLRACCGTVHATSKHTACPKGFRPELLQLLKFPTSRQRHLNC